MKRKKKLTEREREIIQKYYEKEGYKIKKRLPGRSQVIIRSTALSMGLSSPKDYERPLWAEEEIRCIKENSNLSIDQLHELLPWRSRSALNHKLQRLGIQKDSDWTADEIAILKKYNGRPPEGMLNRSKVSIEQKARRLGIIRRRKWDAEEIEILKRYGTEVPDGMLNRTKRAIHTKVCEIHKKEKNINDG